MSRPNNLIISSIKRNQRFRGPTSSDQQNDFQSEIIRDFTIVQQEWNNKIVPLTSKLPDGTTDRTLDAFINGLDGQTMFVSADATSSLSAGRFYNSTKDRPNTVFEEFISVFDLIDEAAQGLTGPQGPAGAIATFLVTSEAQQLASPALAGDVAIRTDTSQSFILKTKPATILSNWQQLLFPGILSVNGDTTSALILDAADVGAESEDPGVHTVTYDATVDLSFDPVGSSPIKTLALTGAVTFTFSNLAAGRGISVRIVCDGTGRALAFPAGVIFLGTAAPTTIAASKTGVVSFTAYGATNASVIAAYGVEP